jgi:hypothetical protein
MPKEKFVENKENYSTNPIKSELKLDMSKESINKSNTKSKENIEVKTDDISTLRKSYVEMKSDRLKTEKDLEHLEQKLKMLQAEELSALKQFENEKKTKEEYELARQKTVEFKKMMNQAKETKKKETDEMSKKIKDMKDYIQRSMNVKKMMRFQENRLSNLQLKQKKLEIDEKRRSMIKEENTRNKRMAESVKLREKNYLDKKRSVDEEKKMKLKKDLEQKLFEEQRMKKMFENKLTTLEEIESGLLKRIKNSDEIDKSDRKYRSSSTGADRKKM